MRMESKPGEGGVDSPNPDHASEKRQPVTAHVRPLTAMQSPKRRQ
jgi:hypothetical protein